MRTFREFLTVAVSPTALADLFPAIVQTLGFLRGRSAEMGKEEAPPPERRGWGEGPSEVCRKAEQLLNQTLGEIRVRDGTGIKTVACHFLCEGEDGVLSVELTGTAVAGDAAEVPRFVKKLIRHSRRHMFREGVLIECELKKLFVSECPIGEGVDLLHKFHFSVHTHVMALDTDPEDQSSG
jgi:hypothetical protein